MGAGSMAEAWQAHVAGTVACIIVLGCGNAGQPVAPGAPAAQGLPGVVAAPATPSPPGVVAAPGVQGWPAVPVTPAGSAAPAAPAAPAPPGAVAPPGVPQSFGVPECDRFAALMCARGPERCDSATRSFASWRWTVGMSPIARSTITQGCAEAAASLAQMSGTPAAPAGEAAAWGGQDTLTCSGNDVTRITGVTATLAISPAIRAGGHCTLELVDCNITAPVVIDAGGHATVTVTGGRISGTQQAVSASGSASVNVSATTVVGTIERRGPNAIVTQ
ncbi:MAG: hypothetical protein HYY06_05175 [Deltaproteobacteria bacterium]|nr:hypothetical protein [Deltaproteobacteria bacterium]